MRGIIVAALVALGVGLHGEVVADDLDETLEVLQSPPRSKREKADLNAILSAVRLYLTSSDPGDTDAVLSAARALWAEPNLRKAKKHLERVSRGSKYSVAKLYIQGLVRERLSYVAELRAAMRDASDDVQPKQFQPSSSSARGPPCAENGSCYGDTSELTGRPKTVPVRGYYRKDGTYVRGHYRSRSRR